MKNNLLVALGCWAALASCQGQADSQRNILTTGTQADTAAAHTTQHSGDSATVAAPAAKSADQPGVAMARAQVQQLFKDDLAKGLIPEESRKFTLSSYDLNGDGSPEVFVGLTGPYFCGSGGCTVLLFNPAGALVTRFTVTRDPVVVAPERTNGWHNLLLESGSNYHVVKFDGKKYPANPSVQPVQATAPAAALPRMLDDAAVPASEWVTF